EMAEEQASWYERIKSEYRNALLDNQLQQKKQGNQIMLLQGLTKLRQMANHPAMLDPETAFPSGRFDTVIEMLQSIVAENHKVMIFSQIVTHLQLFRTYFDREKIAHAYLDGHTRHRADAVEAFKEKD